MVFGSLEAVVGLKLHWVDQFDTTFGVLSRAFKMVALTSFLRNEGFREIKIKTH